MTDETDPVIVQMRQRINLLKSQIATHDRNRSLYQGVVDSHVDAIRKAKDELERTEAAIEVLTNQDTVQLDVPRHIVTEALNDPNTKQ